MWKENINMKRSILRKIKRSIKFWWQRRTRGWDDSETWNLDVSLAKLILPRLKKFKQIKNGSPSLDEIRTDDDWDIILDKMIIAFNFIQDEEKFFDVRDERKEEYKQTQEGLDLFSKYFMSLWD